MSTHDSRFDRLWSLVRLVAAVAIIAAVVGQGIVTVGGAAEKGREVGVVTANFFSFFTILSNVLSVIVLVWAGLWFWARGRGNDRIEPRGLTFALASVTTYMIVTGLVYNLLLRGAQLEPGATLGWSNEILHLAGPLFFLVDLFVAPRRRRLPWRGVAGILIFPIVWVAYTLIRAPFVVNPVTGNPWWYPYPFLDPHNFDSGYLAVAGYIVGIAVAIGAAAVLVVGVGRRRGSLPSAEERGARAR